MHRVSRARYHILLNASYKTPNSVFERHFGGAQRRVSNRDLVTVAVYDTGFEFGGVEDDFVQRFARTDFGREVFRNYVLMPPGYQTEVDAVSLEPGYAAIDFKVDRGVGFGISKTQAERCFIFVFKKLANSRRCVLNIMRHAHMLGAFNGSLPASRVL
jgi:hypothetical protein